MKSEQNLADALDEYMQDAGYDTSRLANHINQLFDRPHQTLISWRYSFHCYNGAAW